MRLDTKTQTFFDFDYNEAIRLRVDLEKLILKGEITSQLRDEFFEPWRIGLGYDDRQGLLLMSTAFPQRMLLSLLYEFESYLGKKL